MFIQTETKPRITVFNYHNVGILSSSIRLFRQQKGSDYKNNQTRQPEQVL